MFTLKKSLFQGKVYLLRSLLQFLPYEEHYSFRWTLWNSEKLFSWYIEIGKCHNLPYGKKLEFPKYLKLLKSIRRSSVLEHEFQMCFI